ncbi:hypothetical protein SDC9_184761 [bioreactor metagenome]|uniref:Uncharacterized protein n=1 Tax=bioreactor metagenome TaxID=1076179 RepID=A0A645HDX8_9ZZZZ
MDRGFGKNRDKPEYKPDEYNENFVSRICKIFTDNTAHIHKSTGNPG